MKAVYSRTKASLAGVACFIELTVVEWTHSRWNVCICLWITIINEQEGRGPALFCHVLVTQSGSGVPAAADDEGYIGHW